MVEVDKRPGVFVMVKETGRRLPAEMSLRKPELAPKPGTVKKVALALDAGPWFWSLKATHWLLIAPELACVARTAVQARSLTPAMLIRAEKRKFFIKRSSKVQR